MIGYKIRTSDLVYEMLFIKDCDPSLNTQTDSIWAKYFASKNIAIF